MLSHVAGIVAIWYAVYLKAYTPKKPRGPLISYCVGGFPKLRNVRSNPVHPVGN